MKPTRLQKIYLNKYFTKILGYGNKCTKCHQFTPITNITENLIEFNCESCNRTWAFESKESVKNLLLIGMGVKEISKQIKNKK
jgi:hypothetical protein